MEKVFKVTGAVDIEFLDTNERPYERRTFMWCGAAVHWSTAPTTSENLVLSLKAIGTVAAIFEVKAVDPSTGSLEDWTYTFDGSPIPIDADMLAKITYPNTDGATIDVAFLGYWL